MIGAIKDDGKFYSPMFLEEALLSKNGIKKDGGTSECQKMRKKMFTDKVGKK